MDLGKSDLLSWVSSVGSGSFGFGEEIPPFNPPKPIFGGKDPMLTATSVGLANFTSAQAGGSVFEFQWIALTYS